MKTYYLLLTVFITSCSGIKENKVYAKNACFSKELQSIIKRPEYLAVRESFIDTFRVLKRDVENFGTPVYFDCKLDEAVFFNSRFDNCLLLISIRDKTSTNMFGSSRVIRGKKIHSRWVFSVGMSIDYGKDHFESIGNNDFSNIEMLGRYFILSKGSPNLLGCQLDEAYWFKRVE